MAVRDDTDYFISSAYLNWIYAICQDEPSLHLLADRILPISSPDIIGHSISWSGLTDLLFNVELLLGPAELEKAGRDSWRSTPLRELAQAASLVYRPLDQLLAMYGHTGHVPQVYPLQGEVEQTDEHHAQITLKMQPDAVPCHAFFAFITGQIRQLTVAMAWPAADVAVLRTGTSIRYTIALPQQNKKPQQNQGEQQALASRSIATSLLRQHQDLLHQQHLLTELSLKSERQTAKPQSTSWHDVQMLAGRRRADRRPSATDLLCQSRGRITPWPNGRDASRPVGTSLAGEPVRHTTVSRFAHDQYANGTDCAAESRRAATRPGFFQRAVDERPQHDLRLTAGQ